MKKIETLKLNYEFKNVFDKGNYFVGKQIIIYFYNNNKNTNRLGIAISNKLCNAVKRNYIKRVIRSAYQSFDKINKSKDIVFIWNKKENVENIKYDIIKKDIENAFLKNGIIN